MEKKLYMGDTCGSCPYNDGATYLSHPPKFKCTFTGDFHLGTDKCKVEEDIKKKEDK